MHNAEALVATERENTYYTATNWSLENHNITATIWNYFSCVSSKKNDSKVDEVIQIFEMIDLNG